VSAAAAGGARRLPPVAELAVASLACSVIGAIVLAANVPGGGSLPIVVALLVLAAAILVVNVVLLLRVPAFAWSVFLRVAGWALVGYAVIAGMLGYVFVLDSTPTRQLAAMLAVLALFAVDVPLLLAFSVARYQDPQASSAT
jgi:hypothetical protein